MNENKQSRTGNILLAYESLPKTHIEPPGYIKVTVYLNNTTEGLSCYCDNTPIEEGMPFVKEVIKDDPATFTFNWHLSCFDSWIDLLSRTYEVDHTGFRDFLSKNPALMVLERLRGVG